MTGPEAPPRTRLGLGLSLAIALPALGAMGAVLLLAGGGRAISAPEPTWQSAPGAARIHYTPNLRADNVRPLRPLAAFPGRAGVTPSPLESLAGGVRPAPPEEISIPAAGVDTVVDGVGTNRDGTIRVPGIGRAGWYDGGPRPGEPGRSVIIGHLDTQRGPGLFARVPSLTPGAQVDVTDRRGEVHAYQVVGRAQIPKDRFPTDEVYGGGDSPMLVLVTCGGPFVEGRGYRDNILVYARAA